MKATGSTEVQVNAFNNITLTCLVSRRNVKSCPDLTWHFNNYSKPLQTDGKYVIMALEDRSKCKQAFSIKIVNVTENDEGKYSCYKTCLNRSDVWDNRSDLIELKVFSPPSTLGKKLSTTYDDALIVIITLN